MSSLFVLFCIQCYTSLAPPQHQGQGSADVAELDCRRRHFNTVHGKDRESMLAESGRTVVCTDQFGHVRLIYEETTTVSLLRLKAVSIFFNAFCVVCSPFVRLGHWHVESSLGHGRSIHTGWCSHHSVARRGCGTMWHQQCSWLHWCILVHIGAYWCLASLQRGFVLQIPKAFACFADF